MKHLTIIVRSLFLIFLWIYRLICRNVFFLPFPSSIKECIEALELIPSSGTVLPAQYFDKIWSFSCSNHIAVSSSTKFIVNRVIPGPITWKWTTSMFSAPEPKALLSTTKCTIVITLVRRLSSLTFHISDFFSETAERNSTKPDRKQDVNVLYKVCVFRADRKNKMAALASDWLRHFRLLLWNFTGSKILIFSTKFVFSTSPLTPLNGIQQNFTESAITTSSTKCVFFSPIGKARWPPWPLMCWNIFDFSS